MNASNDGHRSALYDWDDSAVHRFLLLIDRIMPMFATPFGHRFQTAA